MGYLAGLFRGSMTKVLVPGVGWWVEFFDVEPRGEQKVVSNSPSVLLDGRQAWESAGYCYDYSLSQSPCSGTRVVGDMWYSDRGPPKQ